MTTTLAMSHRLDRSILIHAARDTVFGYFTDSTRWARWWGQGSTIEAEDGFVEERVVFAEIRPMTGQEPFHVAIANATERFDK